MLLWRRGFALASRRTADVVLCRKASWPQVSQRGKVPLDLLDLTLDLRFLFGVH